jgi:hypothetical protein
VRCPRWRVMLNRVRIRVGELLLRLAFRVLDVDPQIDPSPLPKEDEEDFDVAPLQPVMMSPKAQEMVRQGMRADDPKPQSPVQPTYLKGSLQERYAKEREALLRR